MQNRLARLGAGVSLSLSAAFGVHLLSLAVLRADPPRKPAKATRESVALPSPKSKSVGVVAGVKQSAGPQTPSVRRFRETVEPFLRKYCVDCHGKDTQNGGVNFEALIDSATAPVHRKTWDRARKMLGFNTMPPADHEPRPSEADVAAALKWIDRDVFDLDCEKRSDPGHVTIRRLNRREYNNTVRDLIGVPLSPADDFPSDDVGNGFDNQGDVLSLSPLLLEKYLAAAERVSSVALFGVDLRNPPVRPLEMQRLSAFGSAQLFRKKYAREKQFLLSSAATVSGEFDCPVTGEYVFCVVASARQAGDEVTRMTVRIDQQTSRVLDVPGELKSARYEIRLPLSKGRHEFRATFPNWLTEPPPPRQPEPPRADSRKKAAQAAAQEPARELILERFELQGPFEIDPREPALASVESRRRILVCAPGPDGTPSGCASRILTRFAARAFRRPVAAGELQPYVELVVARAQNDPFDRAIHAGLTAILVSPHFLFRVEHPGSPAEGSGAVLVGDFELASRLSYFLWSSMPDDELFRIAAEGSLHKPDVLAGQVRRMLRDAKSQALISNFGEQWLNLPHLDLARPNSRVFHDFDPELRADMRKETELFLASIVRDDRSILDLLNGKYTFLNERLARHYKIAGVSGPEFRQVSLEGYPRAGVLTHGSILTLTSQPTRTSPVKRGKWILETMLGTPPPPPPANVPDLSATQNANPKASLREQLALHRKRPACATCHKVMDPLGLGLENFDGIGRWRQKDGEQPIDSTGTLPGGESFRGPIELIGVLGRREEVFRRHLAQTLLAYALGRGIEYDDKCAIDRIVAGTRHGGNRLSVLVGEIVTSDPFLKRRGGGDRHER